MRMVDLILAKRDGAALSTAEIRWVIDGYVKGQIPDYQVASLLMAIYFRGMNAEETLELVKAMIDSGETIDLSSIHGIKVDKHSTGGVGDKTSIVLAPMVAATGIPVAKMSGRGLGHTGGTLDKLESFTGFQIEQEMDRFVEIVNEFGIAIIGQTANLVPADKKLYALRDVTGTVENLSLIAGSIMSKKLASGADAIVLDVKSGAGAFMKTDEDSFALAQKMVEIGTQMGRKTVAVVSRMDQPLGDTIGNAIEIQEAIATLRGEGPADLLEVCLELGAEMVVLGGKAKNAEQARALLLEGIRSGAALEKLRQMVRAQGGDATLVDQPERLPGASMTAELRAESDGCVVSLDALEIGHSAMLLGAGRETKDSTIDLGAGIRLHAKIGTAVKKGDLLATLYANDAGKLANGLASIACAFVIKEETTSAPPLILGKVTL
jgi:pyrimidine-nucleoside phosphorylase